MDKQQVTGATPSGSGCQPAASAADASSQSGIPSAGGFTVEPDHDISAHGGWHDDEREITQSVAFRSEDGQFAIIVAEINYPNCWDDESFNAVVNELKQIVGGAA